MRKARHAYLPGHPNAPRASALRRLSGVEAPAFAFMGETARTLSRAIPRAQLRTLEARAMKWIRLFWPLP